MLSPTVIGVVLHRLGLKYNFGQVEVQRGEAELDFNLTEIVLHWSCTRLSTTDSNQVHRGHGEVQRGEAISNVPNMAFVFSFQNERNSCNTIGIKDRTSVKNIDFKIHIYTPVCWAKSDISCIKFD